MSDTHIPVALRREVIERAGNCCEYCRLSQDDNYFTFHVDHIISEKHQGATISDNLCLSCPSCNIAKGSDIAGADPITGNATFLYHPRQQQWNDHFELVGAVIQGKTAEGLLTVQLLQMNSKERVTEREGLIELGRYPCQPD
jgi:hypothetical protein